MIMFPAVEIQHDYNLTRLQVYCYANAKKKQNRASVLNQYIKCFLQPSWNMFNIVCGVSNLMTAGLKIMDRLCLTITFSCQHQNQMLISLPRPISRSFQSHIMHQRMSGEWGYRQILHCSDVVYTKIIRPRKNYYN